MDFSLPPLWADETSPFVMALSIVSPQGSDLYHYSKEWGAHIGKFPVAWQHYNGNAVASYLSVPFLYFAGITVTAIRLYELAVAIAVLVLTYYLGKELFSKTAAMIGTSLLSVLASFVFYSRQSPLYDWTDLCIALLVIIFGIRYLRQRKAPYLAASVFLLGVGVYEYLWFAWIVIGLVATMPLWIKKIKFDTKSVAVISLCAVLGFSHVIIGYALSPTQSLVPFALDVLSGSNTQYAHPQNTNFLGNAAMRSSDLFSFFSKPGVAFSFYNSSLPFDAVNYTFLVIFALTTAALIICICKRVQDSRKIASVLVLTLGIFVSSMFTISEFLPIQMSVMLPFLFISIGKGLDIMLSQLQSKKLGYLVPVVIVLLAMTQAPTLAQGFGVMHDSPTAQTAKVYEEIGSYVTQNSLRPVSLDFFSAKVIPFYSQGKLVPIVMQWTLPQSSELDRFREPMSKIDTLDLRSNYIFLTYSYPNFPDCSQPSFEQKPVCSDIQYIEDYATKNNLKVQRTNFALPDGTNFVTGLELK